MSCLRPGAAQSVPPGGSWSSSEAQELPSLGVQLAGVAWICVLEAAPYIPLVYILEFWGTFLHSTIAHKTAYLVFWLSLPHLFTYGYAAFYFVVLWAQKRLLVGRFEEGTTRSGWLRR